MDSADRNRELERLFHEALERSTEDRPAFLDATCPSELRTELDQLLALDQEHTGTELRSPMTRPVPSEPTPERIGPYRIVRVLGEGGMGQVVLAEQIEPVQRLVALKLVRADRSSREVLARFEAERQVLARMRHDHVARILDAGTGDDGRAYLVMEYVEGLPLDEYCARHSLTLEQRLELFVQVCRGVQHAHQNGIIHRDLKSANVLVETQDDRPVPKIIDFGIAKVLDASAESALDTRPGLLLGTPEFMSPEQAAGSVAIDARTDVWSLGTMLYELITGGRPFVRGDGGDVELLRRIREDEVERPSRRLESAPGGPDRRELTRVRMDLDWIVRRALEKDPEDRYPSASELAADVERCLQDEPIEAGPPSTWYRYRKFVRKHSLVVGAGIAVAAALVLGTAVSLWQAGAASRNAAQAGANLTLAEQRLTDYRRMVDVRRLDELRRAVRDELWPADALLVPQLHRWLEREAELGAKIPTHRERIAEITRLLTAPEDLEEDPEELAWQRDTLQELVTGYEALVAETVSSPRSTVRRLLERAGEAVQREQEIEPEVWDECIASIADPDDCPLYEGLQIVPQRGLVPLGRNSRGLWEFWHVASGERPDWDPDEVWSGAEDGVVLVLLPAAQTRLGARRPGSSRRTGPHVDSRCQSFETPPHDVELDAFFLAKFELTQGQWIRFHDHNPSLYAAPRSAGRVQVDLTSPVETVSWTDCQIALRRMGLGIPTEAQWEYACRAGTTTVFHCGDEDADLFDHGVNLADGGSTGYFAAGWYHEADLDDDFNVHAPVGTYPANPFGLHDMHGNLSEWCQDRFVGYGTSPRNGDGLRIAKNEGEERRVYRGGSFNELARQSRSAARFGQEAGLRIAAIGVRAARPLDSSVRQRTPQEGGPTR